MVQDFIEVTVVTLKKKTESIKSRDNRTICLVVHAAKMVVSILSRRIQRNIEVVLEEDQFGCRKKRSYGCNWDAENNNRRKYGHR